jgi:histidine phosphotransferase ChpT
MSVTVDFHVLELLCGRLCHELISPVGAINNGVELLDEDDPEFVKEAMALIAQSARRAGQRLQFYRFAYGTVGASGSAVDGRELVQGLLDGGKVRCVWPAEASALAPPWQRLALNILVLALELLPRGGTVTIEPIEHGVAVAAEGDAINITDDLKSVLAGEVAAEALSARTVHGFFTMRLAEEIGARLALTTSEATRAVLSARAGA